METNGTTVDKYCNLELLLQHSYQGDIQQLVFEHIYQSFTELEMSRKYKVSNREPCTLHLR